ncbi:hypothetical protein [Kitasatospora sp. McL0602]|uniref:hypothetical protein n=1 Tax=Kitasatospora sp. McL0602 TaxID=3439530 RepID=UPI003F8AE2C9
MGNTNSISGGEFGVVIQAGTVNLAKRQVLPSGLPPRSVFVGREQQLTELAEALAADGELVTVSALSGLGGVGKTALAVEAAYRVKDRFPGGVLFIDLRGYDSSRLSPEQALDTLLHALGEEVPPGLVAKEHLYRSRLAALPDPLLLVADNASAADQITPLLPGDPRHRVLVTSRHTLADRTLTPRHLSIDVLTEPEAVALLTELAGPDPAYAELARLCGRLPLALRIAAALLTDRSPAELVADLTDARERLTELDFGSDFAIRATFDLSYRHLTLEEARLFALLALNPGPDIGLPAATVLADRTERQTARLLRSLTRAHLVTRSGDRYSFHDLVRLYAADCEVEDAADAQQRVVSYYIDTAAEIQAARLPGLQGRQASQWLSAELRNVSEAWKITDPLADRGALLADATNRVAMESVVNMAWVAVRVALIRAGGAEAALDGLISILSQLDGALVALPPGAHRQAVSEAISHTVAVCRLAREIQQAPPGEAERLLGAAVGPLTSLLTGCRRIGEPNLVGEMLLTLGLVRSRLGQPEQATADLTTSIAAFDSVASEKAATVRIHLAELMTKGATESR